MASTSKEYKLAVQIAGSVSSSFNSAMGTAENKMTNLGTIAKQAAAVAAAAWGALKIGEFISDAVSTYSEFEQAMANTSAIASATAEEYDALEQAALAMGKATTKTATECAEALGYMSLAGWSVEESISSLEPVLRLSEATQMDLATCSDLVTDSMSALGLQVSDLSMYLDICTAANNNANTTSEALMEALIGCGGAAKTVGATLLDTSTALGILANNGTKGTEAGTALNSILARISSNTSAINALDELGVSAFDAAGEFVGLQNFLEQTQKALSNLSTEEQAYYLKQVAGTNYFTEMSYLLDSVAESADGTATAWDTLADALENSEGALDAMADTVTDTWEGATARLGSAIDDLKINLVSTFAPYAKDAINAVAEAIPNITEGITTTVQSLMDFAVPKITAFRDRAVELFESIRPKLEAIGEKASAIFSAVGEALSSAFEAVRPALSWIIDTAIPTAINIVLDLVSVFESVVLTVLDFKEVLIAALAVYAAFKAGQAIQSVIQGFQQAKVTLALFKQGAQTANFAQAALNGTLSIGETLTALFTGQMTLAELATAAWSKVTAVASGVMKGLNAVLMANPIALVVAAIAAVIAIVVVLYNKCEWFRNFVNTVASAIVGFVKNAASAIAGFFKNLWSTIQSIWSAVTGWFKSNVIDPLVNFFSPIVEWISGFFQGCWIIIQAVWSVVSTWFNEHVITPLVNFFSAIVGTISGFFTSLWQGIQAVWVTVSTWFNDNVIQPLVNFFAPIVETVSGFFSGLWASICEIWQAAGTWFSEHVATPINNAFQAVSDFVKGIFNSLIGFVEGMINRIVGGINSFISGFNGIVSKAASLIGVDWSGISEIPTVSLPRLAEGGIVDQPTVLEAGEAGSEAIIPLSELWGNLQDMISDSVGGVADRVSALVDRMDDLEIGSSATRVSDLLASLQRDDDGGGDDDTPQPDENGPVYQITYAPQYHFEGEAPSREDLREAESMSQEEFNRKMEQWAKDNARKRF